MKAFSEQKITDFIKSNLKNWSFENKTITRDFKFKTFIDAFSFMTAVAIEAEKIDHHPDWSNSYNKVHIALTSHESGGISQLDFDLAAKIDHIFGN